MLHLVPVSSHITAHHCFQMTVGVSPARGSGYDIAYMLLYNPFAWQLYRNISDFLCNLCVLFHVLKNPILKSGLLVSQTASEVHGITVQGPREENIL